MNCPFCNNEGVGIRIIYRDDLVMAFPTNIPITPGHTLICPARHISKVDQLTGEELSGVRNLLVRLKNSLVKSLGAEGFNIAWNEGDIAGQAVDHLHIHVVPRKIGDSGIYEYEPRKFLYRPGSRDVSPDDELQQVAQLIKKNL